MDERKNNKTDSWDDGVYGTGRTEPPKSNGGIISLLLIIVIFLSGIASGLGILNIRLFNQLNQRAEEEHISISFSDEQESSGETRETGDRPGEACYQEDVTISLNRTPASYENVPQDGAMNWQEIYRKNIPSVVSVSCTGWAGAANGSGVVIACNGYIVTNAHLVMDAEEILIRLSDGRTFPAALVGSDSASDLAVVHIDATNLIPAEFGNSGALRVGDAVAAIGDPLGAEMGSSMVDGMINAINRDVTVAGRTMTHLQTSAFFSGSSGGPLINCYGQVVGIHTAKIGPFTEGDAEGLGFAIPSAKVKEIVDKLIRSGYVSGRPTLGIAGEEITSFYQRYYHMPQGLYITEVRPGGAADLGGLKAGDILISLEGVPVPNRDAVDRLVYSHRVGDTLVAVIYRSGTEIQVELTLTEEH